MKASLIQANALRIPLADESTQMVITSPPYFNAREEYASWPDYAAYLADMATVWAECFRVLCDGGRIAVNVPECYDRTGDCKSVGADTIQMVMAAGFALRGIVIWYKAGICSRNTAWGSWMSASNPVMHDEHEIIIIAHKGNPNRERGKSTIDKCTFIEGTKSVWPVPPISAHWHPAPFPPEIPRRLIELYTYLGDTVLDPFSGSGTTVQVAQRLGRVGIGCDLNGEYLRRSAVPVALNAGDWDLAQRLNGKRTGASLSDLPLFVEKEA